MSDPRTNNCVQCGGVLGGKFYQAVPGVGDLCLGCHAAWTKAKTMAEALRRKPEENGPKSGLADGVTNFDGVVPPNQNPPPTTIIQGNSFVGVKWDATAVSAVQTIAEGLIENAKGLAKLAEVLRASNMHFECMLKVEPPKQ